MDMDLDQPTDDASMQLDGGWSRRDVKSSDSVLTLKRSWSQETMTASSDDLPASSELCPDAIHLGRLAEKGLIDYDSLDLQSENEAGDYPRRLANPLDLGGIAEIVKEMRDEFIGKFCSKAKGLKRILIKGVLQQEQGSAVNQQQDSELANGTTSVAKVALEVPKLINNRDSLQEDILSKDVNPGDEIIQLISDINQFTSEVERDPDSVDWSQFRSNLLKIHRHYVRNPETTTHCQIREPASGISVPQNDLKSQANYLGRNIQGLESKMFNLDQTFDAFSEKFRRSVIGKETVDHDMLLLSIMRDRIGLRLSELEDQFRRARGELYRGTDQKKHLVLPFHNSDA